jgi:hypothetical protein
LHALQALADGPWRQANLDAGANMVIPVPAPLGGAIVVGESAIAYIAKGQTTKATPIKPTTIKVGACRWCCPHIAQRHAHAKGYKLLAPMHCCHGISSPLPTLPFSGSVPAPSQCWGGWVGQA